MSHIPESDKRLISKLNDLLEKVENLRIGLYSRKQGCACTDNALCAHHASVHNRLKDAYRNLQQALRDAEQE